MTSLKGVETNDASNSPEMPDPDYRYLLACYYQEQNKHREAIEEFEKIILVDPRNFKALNAMGISYDVIRNFPKAIESYQKALDLKSDLDYVHNNRGYSYLLQGKPDEAVPCFQRAIALNGHESRFHKNLSLAYAVKGQMDLATLEFRLSGDESKADYTVAHFYSLVQSYQENQRRNAEALTLTFAVKAPSSLDGLESPVKLSQPKAQKAGDTNANSSSLRTEEKGESEIKEEMLPVPPAIQKTNDEEPSGTETLVFPMKEPPEVAEMTNKSEDAPQIRETRMGREIPAMNYVAQGKKLIGQRALELADTESDTKILEILIQEYGKEQLDQWLGISKVKIQMRSEDSY